MPNCSSCGPLAPHDVVPTDTVGDSFTLTTASCGNCGGPVRGR